MRPAFIAASVLVLTATGIEAADSPPPPLPVAVTSIETNDLEGFDGYPSQVRELIDRALALTKRRLGYKYGSADPDSGGMDCSGTIYFLLRAVGIDDVPRTASGQYVWARKAGGFEAVVSRSTDSFELDDLKPGDLMFWTGTYTTERDPPVTHSMIYLGELKVDGRQVMFGASDGRSFGGEKMNGVSVFDFRIPKAVNGRAPRSDFVGYAPVPGLLALEPPLTDADSAAQ